MPWDLGDSTPALQRDIARWRNDLAMFIAAGLGNSGPANTIRGWIAEVEAIIADSRRWTPARGIAT